jgi:hypothetical protein
LRALVTSHAVNEVLFGLHRVGEFSAPRWTTYDAKDFGVKVPERFRSASETY